MIFGLFRSRYVQIGLMRFSLTHSYLEVFFFSFPDMWFRLSLCLWTLAWPGHMLWVLPSFCCWSLPGWWMGSGLGFLCRASADADLVICHCYAPNPVVLVEFLLLLFCQLLRDVLPHFRVCLPHFLPCHHVVCSLCFLILFFSKCTFKIVMGFFSLMKFNLIY